MAVAGTMDMVVSCSSGDINLASALTAVLLIGGFSFASQHIFAAIFSVPNSIEESEITLFVSMI